MRYLLMVDGKDAGEWRAASAQAAIEQLALEAPESKLVTVQAISFEPGSTERLQHAALSSTPVFPARAGMDPGPALVDHSSAGSHRRVRSRPLKAVTCRGGVRTGASAAPVRPLRPPGPAASAG